MQQDTTNPKNIDKKYIKLSRVKRRLLKHVWLVRGMLLGGVLLLIYLLGLLIYGFLSKGETGQYLVAARSFALPSQGKVRSSAGRTNVLILGRGGEEHETPNITDTVIFTSLSHQKEEAAMISLPRDIWIPEIRAKINSAYYWGEEKEEGGGIILAKSVVEEVVGEPVHYAAVIDFSVFRDVVDILGGVEIEVENSFTDMRYPIPGREADECGGDPEFMCRYETVSFEKGTQAMNGEEALKFVRSRNSEGDEGTDIARATRQQKVISAIKDEIFSPGTIFSPRKMLALVRVTQEAVETDIPISSGAVLARRFLETSGDVASYVLDEDFLVNPPKSARYDQLYVFIPKDESWDGVHQWVDSLLP